MREYILQLFKQNDIKRTKPRIFVLDYLLRRDRPVTIEEMYTSLSEKFKLGLTSVYRAVEQLVELGVASSIQLSPKLFAYQLCKIPQHHHHFICTDCGKVEEVVLPELDKLINDSATKARFSLQKHDFSLRGKCDICSHKGN